MGLFEAIKNAIFGHSTSVASTPPGSTSLSDMPLQFTTSYRWVKA
jgi:hypothetical protein